MATHRYYRTTTARSTGLPVTTAHGEDLGIAQEDDGPWYNLCETHSTILSHESLSLAKSWASAPEEWCEECRPLAAERDAAKRAAAAREAAWEVLARRHATSLSDSARERLARFAGRTDVAPSLWADAMERLERNLALALEVEARTI